MSIIVINGQILGFAIVQAGIGKGVADYLAHLSIAPFWFFTLLFVLYLFLGAALDGLAMMLLTVPVLYPTLRTMGFDDIWFGVFLVIQVELAQLAADRAQPARRAVHRARCRHENHHAGVDALRHHAERALLHPLLLPADRALASRNDEVTMFAPPPVIQSRVFARLPDEFRMKEATSDGIAISRAAIRRTR